ncbi:MAG: GNAT family N-acetyltransferase [Cyanobacteria bacterium P01_G01_bin.38]
MSQANAPDQESLTIRAVHFRDLDKLIPDDGTEIVVSGQFTQGRQLPAYLRRMRGWYGPMQLLTLFPNPLQRWYSAFVAERDHQVCGLVQVAPFNRTRSTWRVERVVVQSGLASGQGMPLKLDVASQLLRHCFETIWEAHTWISETDVNDNFGLALYRQNGFQPLARITYWSVEAERLQAMAEHEPDLPNLLPVSNADAQLIYQLETVSMPPQVRQVFDHQIQDFRSNVLSNAGGRVSRWMRRVETVSAYVFEPQRKAAIGYFQLKLCRDGSQPHLAKLTVHPAYTWLYPELMAQMARVVQGFPAQALRLASLDYQPEREGYFKSIQANEVEHTVMMSRSVWHKVRESKMPSLEGLHLPDVLQGLQPSGNPIPGRFSWSAEGPAQRPLVGPSDRSIRWEASLHAPDSQPKALEADGDNDLNEPTG